MSGKSVYRRLSSGHQPGVRGSMVRGKQDATPERGLKDTASYQGRNLGSELQSKDRDGSQWMMLHVGVPECPSIGERKT